MAAGERGGDFAEDGLMKFAAWLLLSTIALAGAGFADVVLPPMDAKRGRELYINKGCIGCHAVNGVGGQHGAPLDAASMDPAGNPFELFARMWIGMKPMIAMQEDKMGQQVDLTAQELGDLVAFIHNAELQKSITISEIPDNIEDIMED
jgi:mono/diheme cytochrome c family protein